MGMGRRKSSRIMSALLALVMAVSMIVIAPNADRVEAASATLQYNLTGSTKNLAYSETPYGKHGKLHVDGIYLKDSKNEKYQLRGASLHGLQWDVGYNYISKASFQSLRDEWGVTAIRLPVYVTQGGYTEGAASAMDTRIQNAVKYATDLGMYILIDWHVHDAYGNPANPNNWKSQATKFFEKYAKMYKDYGNVLYEICNEPISSPWYEGHQNDLYSYANSMVNTIRKYTDGIVICGTNTWSQQPEQVIGHKLSQKNVMYTFHFYSATHIAGDGNFVYDNVKRALNNGIPVFCSEFGICDASGNGNYNIDSANKWMSLMDQYSISYFCWHLSNKGESSAYLKTSCSKKSGWTNNDLSTTGAWFVNVNREHESKEKPSGPVTVYNGTDYSAVFNYNYYVNKYPDIKKAFGTDYLGVLKHFVTCGMKEGRQAIATFDVKSYKNKYQGLRVSFGNDLPKYYYHYMNYGKKEGRVATGVTTVQDPVTKLNGVDYSRVYDFNYYISKYPDLKKVFGNDDVGALKHFVNNGMKEGRQAKATFDVNSYKNAYSNLRKAFGNDNTKYYMHYINYGYKENRKTTGVTKVVNPITVLDGVDYSRVYNYEYYTTKYPSLKKIYGNDDIAVLKHFVNYGMKEGRQGSSEFCVQNYKARYAGLRSAFGNNNVQYYMHYINYGYKEHRNGR